AHESPPVGYFFVSNRNFILWTYRAAPAPLRLYLLSILSITSIPSTLVQRIVCRLPISSLHSRLMRCTMNHAVGIHLHLRPRNLVLRFRRNLRHGNLYVSIQLGDGQLRLLLHLLCLDRLRKLLHLVREHLVLLAHSLELCLQLPHPHFGIALVSCVVLELRRQKFL